ncbi:MAG: hypothetical protein LBT37_03455 [Lactobacillaceae bacterium]|jgi:hypothetical protein|nr:hypothetical protein [Lactobacillaceae bacterium]
MNKELNELKQQHADHIEKGWPFSYSTAMIFKEEEKLIQKIEAFCRMKLKLNESLEFMDLDL